MTRIFFDCEFTGLHKNTTLISIGLISENGKKFYAEFNDYDMVQVDDWIQDNVVNHLKYKNKNNYVSYSAVGTGNTVLKSDKETIKEYLTGWLKQFDSVELISDVCHYDMVLLIDIFGTAFDLPNHVSPVCHDINQDIANYFGISEIDAFNRSREEILNDYGIKIKGDKHNALYDAKVIKGLWEIMNTIDF